MLTEMTGAERFIADQLTEGFLILDSSLNTVYCNPSLLAQLEGAPEDLYGKPLSIIAASPDAAILLSGSPSSGIVAAEVRSFTGRLIHFEFSFSPLIGENETLEGFAVVLRDSGEREKLLGNMEARAKRYRDVAIAGSDWFWEVDSTGTYTFVCPEVKAFLGYTPEELFGTSAFDLMPHGEGQRVASIFNRIASRGVPFKNLLNTVLTRSGEVRTVASSGVPLLDSEGGLRGYRGTDREVTPGRGMLWEAELQLETLDRITAKLPFPAAVIEKSGRIRMVNTALCQLTGRTTEQMVGKMYETVLSGSPFEGFDGSSCSAVREGAIPSSGGMVAVKKTRVSLDICGGVYCLEFLVRSCATTPAEKKDRDTEEVQACFLSSLSSAMGGMAGFGDMLENGQFRGKARMELIEMYRHHASTVYRTLESIRSCLEYSAKEFTTEEESFFLSNLTGQVMDIFRIKAERRRILCRVQTERSLNGRYSGPFRGIKVILSRLLEGVSSTSEVLLGVTEVDSSATSSIVRFSLTVSLPAGKASGSDTGFQETLSRCRSYSNALGVELIMGSAPSGGFRVWTDIPLTRCGGFSGFNGKKRAMVFSGNPHMTFLYSRMLESLGCEVPRVNGSSPVASAASLLRDGSDAAFLLFDADSILRGANIPGNLDEIPGIADTNTHKVLLSSRVKPGDIQDCLSRGFSALLLKPVRLGRLGACLQLAASMGKGRSALITDNSFPMENYQK